MMGKVAAWWVGPTALFQERSLLLGSGWSCAQVGGQPCSVPPSPTQPSPWHSNRAESGTAGAGKGLAGYVPCRGRNGRGVRRKLLRRNHSAARTLLCSASNSKDPRGAGFMATRFFSTYLFVAFIKPRNGPDENRKGEQALPRRSFSRGRKPQQEAASGVCSSGTGLA